MAHCVLGLCWELELVLKKPRFSEGDRTHKWPVTDGDAKFWDDVNDAYRIEEGAASVTPSSLCSLRYILRLLVRQLRRHTVCLWCPWWGCREGAERKTTFLRAEDCMGELFIGKVGGLRDSEAVPRGDQR